MCGVCVGGGARVCVRVWEGGGGREGEREGEGERGREREGEREREGGREREDLLGRHAARLELVGLRAAEREVVAVRLLALQTPQRSRNHRLERPPLLSRTARRQAVAADVPGDADPRGDDIAPLGVNGRVEEPLRVEVTARRGGVFVRYLYVRMRARRRRART
eukprot:COSAG03_NODE_3568_length_1946_cov_1.520845_3_plen_164_part_00